MINALVRAINQPVLDRLRTVEQHLGRLIVATTAAVIERLDAATNEVASDLADLREQLKAAVANADEQTKAAVEAELAKLDPSIKRLEALGADPSDPVPAPEPTPAPEPAPEA